MSISKVITLTTLLLGIFLTPSTLLASGYVFNTNMRYGDNNEDVRQMQIVLNADPRTQVSKSGAGSEGNESTYFGSLTLSAVYRFQALYVDEVLAPVGLTAPSGYVGQLSRAKLNSLNNETVPTAVEATQGSSTNSNKAAVDVTVPIVLPSVCLPQNGQYHEYDLNKDCEVNNRDVAVVATHIDNGTYTAIADVNSDGHVDTSDLAWVRDAVQQATNDDYSIFDLNLDGSIDNHDVAEVTNTIDEGLYRAMPDVNSDGHVDTSDLAWVRDAVQQYDHPYTIYNLNLDGELNNHDVAEVTNTIDEGLYRAMPDVNSDGEVDLADLTFVRAFVEQWGDSYSVYDLNLDDSYSSDDVKFVHNVLTNNEYKAMADQNEDGDVDDDDLQAITQAIDALGDIPKAVPTTVEPSIAPVEINTDAVEVQESGTTNIRTDTNLKSSSYEKVSNEYIVGAVSQIASVLSSLTLILSQLSN